MSNDTNTEARNHERHAQQAVTAAVDSARCAVLALASAAGSFAAADLVDDVRAVGRRLGKASELLEELEELELAVEADESKRQD